MTGNSPLSAVLERLRETLPSGSIFTYRVHEGELELGVLGIPRESRGVGTTFLAGVLAAAAQAGVDVRLGVDATDHIDDPSNFELIRWYTRFGFELLGEDRDGRFEMLLTPGETEIGEILAVYAARKREDVGSVSVLNANFECRDSPGAASNTTRRIAGTNTGSTASPNRMAVSSICDSISFGARRSPASSNTNTACRRSPQSTPAPSSPP